jgi:hypothetical protein
MTSPTVIWCIRIFLVVENLVVEAQQINRYRVFTGEVLLYASQEGLREIEAGYPENARGVVVKPVL